MRALLVVAIAVLSFCSFAENAAPVADGNKSGDATEENSADETFLARHNIEIEVEADIYSAYVWRGAVVSDRPVAQPCVSVDWTFLDPFYVGFYVWENNDLTGRRRGDGYRGEWNEWDYNVHAGVTLWSNDSEKEDDAMNLSLEIGHEWFTYNVHGEYYDDSGSLRKNRKDNPTTYEWYARLEFENPIVTPYFQTSWEYQRWNGMYAEVGLKKEITLASLFNKDDNAILEQFTLSGDLCAHGGSWKYLDSLYSGSPSGYEDDDGVSHRFKSGLNAATFKGGLSWSPCSNFSVGLVIAYTATLSNEIRDACKEYGGVKRDLVWGGVEATISF